MIIELSAKERWVLLPVVALWALAAAVLLCVVIFLSLPLLGLGGGFSLALGAACAASVVVVVVHAWVPARKNSLAGVALGCGACLAWLLLDPMGSGSSRVPAPPGLAGFGAWAAACAAGSIAWSLCRRRSRRRAEPADP